MSGADDSSLNELGVPTAEAPETTEAPTLTRRALDEVMRPLAVAAMLTCIAISLAQAVSAFEVRWAGGAFAILVFLVALESIHARRFLERTRLDSRDRWRFRFVEWVVLVLAARFVPYTELGGPKLVADLAKWSASIGSFFDFGFIAHVALVAAFWGMAYVLSQALDELEASPLERPVAITDPNYYLRSTMPQQGRVDRQARVNRIVGLFFAGGVVILLLAAAARVNVQELISLRHPRSTGVILNVLVYFLIGFLLISHARYTILKANWELQNIPVLGNMARRWLLLVLGFLAVVGLISALLPVSYSVGIMDTIGTVVRWVFYVLVQIAFFVLFAISYVIGLILSLFTGKPANTAPSMAQPVAPPAPAATPGDPNPWWQLIRSLLFWTVLFGIVGYSLFQFLVYRLHLLDNVRLQRLIGWFQRLFAGIRRTARRAVQDVRQRIAARLAASRRRAEQRRWRYVSLRKLSPRDRVRYFYLSVLRRSAEQGYARPPSATPMEFEPKLVSELPEVAGEVDVLTQAFVEARYSEHPLADPQAAGVQGVWRRVRRALTAHKRHADAP